MKLTPILLLIAIAFTPRVQAQENFQDGYVVTPGGDTLRGRIDFRDWAVNPGKIVFLDGRTGQRVEYTGAGMTAFGVRQNGSGAGSANSAGVGSGGGSADGSGGADWEVYRSYTVRLYPYSQDPAVVTLNSWTGQPYDTAIFLRRVTAGRLSLWGYRDSSDVVYFFIQTGRQTPVQLKIQNRVVRHGAASDVYTDKVYQYQLADYVSACAAIADKPVPVAYEENGLKALIDTYNQCGVEILSPGKKRLVTVNILPMAGYLHSSVKPWGNTDAGYATWKAYGGPMGGLGFWLQPGRGSKALKRWGILIDGLYDQFLVHSNAIQVNYYQRYSGKMEYSEIRGDIQLRYAQPVGDFRPFLGVGFSNTLVINYESSQKLVDASDNTTITQPLFGTSGLEKKYRPGGFGVVGVAWKRWSLEVRYEKTTDLVNTTTGIKAPVTNLYALAGFRF